MCAANRPSKKLRGRGSIVATPFNSLVLSRAYQIRPTATERPCVANPIGNFGRNSLIFTDLIFTALIFIARQVGVIAGIAGMPQGQTHFQTFSQNGKFFAGAGQSSRGWISALFNFWRLVIPQAHFYRFQN